MSFERYWGVSLLGRCLSMVQGTLCALAVQRRSWFLFSTQGSPVCSWFLCSNVFLAAAALNFAHLYAQATPAFKARKSPTQPTVGSIEPGFDGLFVTLAATFQGLGAQALRKVVQGHTGS